MERILCLPYSSIHYFIPSSIIRIVEIMQKKEDKKEIDDDKTDAEKGTKLVEIKE